MVDVTISRVRLRDLARPGRGAALPPRPRSGQLAPGAADLAPSTI